MSPLSQLDGLKSLEDFRRRLSSEETRAFTLKNQDLLRLFQEDTRLQEILRTQSIQTREDLQDVVITGALERLDRDTFITREFLEQNFNLAKLISQNVGGLADLLNQDQALARALVTNGSVIGGRLLDEVVQEALDLLGQNSTIPKAFFEDHIEAALYILQNPQVADRLKNDSSEAQQFMNEIDLRRAAFDSATVELAKSLLNRPATFTTGFLEQNIGFARLVVASDLVDGGQSLAEYVRSLPFIENSPISTENLVAAYESRLAANQLSLDFPLSEAFFAQNRPLTFLVLRSDVFTEHLKRQEGEMERLFGPDLSFSTPMEKGILPLIADRFQSRFEPLQGSTLDLYV